MVDVRRHQKTSVDEFLEDLLALRGVTPKKPTPVLDPDLEGTLNLSVRLVACPLTGLQRGEGGLQILVPLLSVANRRREDS